jgi:hypothetical protein
VVPEKMMFKPKGDFMSVIFEILKDRCNYNSDKTDYLDVIERKVIARGYSSTEFNLTLKNYENLNVIMIEDNKVRLLS